MRKFLLKLTNIYYNLYFKLLFISNSYKLIFTQKSVALHFYENFENTSPTKDLNHFIFSDIFTDSNEEKYNSFNYDSSNKILNKFIINLDTFLLKFIFEEKIQDCQQYNIYINNCLLSYKDFILFYAIIDSFPCFIENMDEYKYHLIFRILAIFKFKNNKSYKEFIRIILTSLLYNPKSTKKWPSLLKEQKNYSSSLDSKIVILELFKLYRFSQETLYKVKDISHANSIIKYVHFDFINLSDDFFYLDTDIITEITKVYRNSKNIFKILDIVFEIYIFRCIFMYQISYTDEQCNFFDLSLFKNMDEIILFECSETELLIQKIYHIRPYKSIKAISIIFSKFTIRDEISWLETLDFEKLNYVLKKYEFLSLFCDSDQDLLIKNIIIRFKQEIYNKENESNILCREGDCSCYDQSTRIDLRFHQDRNKIEKFRNLKLKVQIFVSTELSNSFIDLNFYIINFTDFKNIVARFSDTYVKDFKLRDSEIFNNIVKIEIIRSSVCSIFLSRILLYPSLKKVFLSDCNILFNQNKVTLHQNKMIESFYYSHVFVDDKNFILEFIYKMIGLKTLEIIGNKKVTNIFPSKSDGLNYNLANLCQLKYSIKYHHGGFIPLFSIFPNIIQFSFGFDYPEGTLYKIFYKKPFNCLKRLKLNRICIDDSDKYALEKYKDLICIHFSETCKFIEISFSELFNLSDRYLLAELVFPNIEFSHSDFQFLLKLKSLKKVYFHSFTLKTDIIYFLKVFSSVEEFAIEKILIHKNLIIEEFGTKIFRQNKL